MSSQVGTYTELDAVGRQFEPYIKARLYPPLPHGVEAGFETHTASIQRRAVRREYRDARPTTARDCHADRRPASRVAARAPLQVLLHVRCVHAAVAGSILVFRPPWKLILDFSH